MRMHRAELCTCCKHTTTSRFGTMGISIPACPECITNRRWRVEEAYAEACKIRRNTTNGKKGRRKQEIEEPGKEITCSCSNPDKHGKEVVKAPDPTPGRQTGTRCHCQEKAKDEPTKIIDQIKEDMVSIEEIIEAFLSGKAVMAFDKEELLYVWHHLNMNDMDSFRSYLEKQYPVLLDNKEFRALGQKVWDKIDDWKLTTGEGSLYLPLRK